MDTESINKIISNCTNAIVINYFKRHASNPELSADVEKLIQDFQATPSIFLGGYAEYVQDEITYTDEFSQGDVLVDPMYLQLKNIENKNNPKDKIQIIMDALRIYIHEYFHKISSEVGKNNTRRGNNIEEGNAEAFTYSALQEELAGNIELFAQMPFEGLTQEDWQNNSQSAYDNLLKAYTNDPKIDAVFLLSEACRQKNGTNNTLITEYATKGENAWRQMVQQVIGEPMPEIDTLSILDRLNEKGIQLGIDSQSPYKTRLNALIERPKDIPPVKDELLDITTVNVNEIRNYPTHQLLDIANSMSIENSFLNRKITDLDVDKEAEIFQLLSQREMTPEENLQYDISKLIARIGLVQNAYSAYQFSEENAEAKIGNGFMLFKKILQDQTKVTNPSRKDLFAIHEKLTWLNQVVGTAIENEEQLGIYQQFAAKKEGILFNELEDATSLVVEKLMTKDLKNLVSQKTANSQNNKISMEKAVRAAITNGTTTLDVETAKENENSKKPTTVEFNER